MFCPNCGTEDNRANQYCRSCGSDLRPIQYALTPERAAGPALSARDEIGRAIAEKIREFRSPSDLAEVAEDVLPEVEQFLEGPQQKRLRRMRDGMIVSSAGFGVTTGFTLAAIFADIDLLFFAALGVVTFFLGLGFILNGYFLTVPKGPAEEDPGMDERANIGEQTGALLMPKGGSQIFGSVTEGTTRHLKRTDNDED